MLILMNEKALYEEKTVKNIIKKPMGVTERGTRDRREKSSSSFPKENEEKPIVLGGAS